MLSVNIFPIKFLKEVHPSILAPFNEQNTVSITEIHYHDIHTRHLNLRSHEIETVVVLSLLYI